MSFRARLAAAAAAVLAVASILLLVEHFRDLRLVALTAGRVDAGRAWSPSERFERYVRFANAELKDPGYAGLSSLPVRLYYRFNPMHPGPGDVIRWGADYRGSCGSFTRVVVAMLRTRGIDSRPLLLRDPDGRSIHTVVEAWVDGRWVVADPQFGVIFRNRAGQLATAAELSRDTSLVYAESNGGRDYPPQYNYLSYTRMNWEKIPVLLPAVRSAFVHAFGAERVDAMARPSIWMWPQAAWGIACGAGAIVCATVALRGRARASVRRRR